MKALADPANFNKQCADIFARMIDTVPATVTLSEVITPIEVKPWKIAVTLGANNTLQFSGHIRVRTTNRDDSKLSVSIQYRDRNNSSTSVLAATRETYQLGQSSGFDKEVFTWYSFSTTLNTTVGVSSFDIILHTSGAADEIHTNNGLGFPISDAILFQPSQSCLPQTSVNDAGQWNLTITAAVRADRVNSPVAFDWVYKRAIPGVLVKALEVQRTVMEEGERGDWWILFIHGGQDI
ncbi:hypothetical protein DID88_007892 [Monilinia fructigena]|uniref:Uncharacterized protein n=1 Tax=Monilinia fructigena TaxID=38457 RepID=A0A395J613_9HELO|nr:hypothetical protein DID88_007892 [Monilinia fructigena]